jgi:hypothetical protein
MSSNQADEELQYYLDSIRIPDAFWCLVMRLLKAKDV